MIGGGRAMENQFESVRSFSAPLTGMESGSTQAYCHRSPFITRLAQRCVRHRRLQCPGTALQIQVWYDQVATGQHVDFPFSCKSARPLCAAASGWRTCVDQDRCWRPTDSQSVRIDAWRGAGGGEAVRLGRLVAHLVCLDIIIACSLIPRH